MCGTAFGVKHDRTNAQQPEARSLLYLIFNISSSAFRLWSWWKRVSKASIPLRAVTLCSILSGPFLVTCLLIIRCYPDLLPWAPTTSGHTGKHFRSGKSCTGNSVASVGFVERRSKYKEKLPILFFCCCYRWILFCMCSCGVVLCNAHMLMENNLIRGKSRRIYPTRSKSW